VNNEIVRIDLSMSSSSTPPTESCPRLTRGNAARSGSWGAVGTFKIASIAALVCSVYVGNRCEQLRTVHQSVFAVLALESQPVDPGL
jgi:PNKP adenylyltransferase domain, C-terminal region